MKLVFINHEREAFISDEKIVTIGSGSDAMIAVDSENVQPEQCRIVADGNQYFLEDSGGGVTMLNGRVVEQRAELASGDLIGVGNVKMRVQDLPAADDEAPAADPMATQKININNFAETQAYKADASSAGDETGEKVPRESGPPKGMDKDETFHGQVNLKDINPHKLLVFKNDQYLKEFPITQKEILIGNGSLSDLQLDSDLIARRHVKMLLVSSGVNLQALQDELKVYVNGEEISRAELVSKDVVTFGDIKLIYLAPGAIVAKDEIADILKNGVIKTPKSKKKFFRIVIGLLGFIVLMLLIGVMSGVWKEKPKTTAALPKAVLDESIRTAIQELINERDWDGALKEIKAKAASLEDAARFEEQVKMEMDSRRAYVSLQEAVDKEQWEKAAEYSRNIPVDSVYFLMMRKLFRDRSEKYTQAAFSDAKYLAGRKNSWDEAMKKLRLVLQLDPDNRAARRLYEKLDRRTKTTIVSTGGDDDTEDTESTVSFYNEFEAAQKLYLDGSLEEALAKFKSLSETITGADAQVMNLPGAITNLEMTQRYYNLGIEARNKGQQLEAVNVWEIMLGPARQVADGRIPVRIAKVRDEIIQYYLPKAAELLKKHKDLESASIYKRILLYDPQNAKAIEGLSAFDQKAKAYLDKGKMVRTDLGCEKAETYFQMVLDLTDESNEIHQEAMAARTDCAK